jgi:hypothetical protein
MICASCRYGGDLSLSYRLGLIPWIGDPRRDVQAAHDLCRGATWCDCQHKFNIGAPPMVTDEKGIALRPVHAGEQVRVVLRQ